MWRSRHGISDSGVVARLRASLQRLYRATLHATDRSGRRARQSRRDSAAALLGSWVRWQMQHARSPTAPLTILNMVLSMLGVGGDHVSGKRRTLPTPADK